MTIEGRHFRTIKGPCFDCDSSCWCGWGDSDECACHSPMGERTAPAAKIEPEQRPNVPPVVEPESAYPTDEPGQTYTIGGEYPETGFVITDPRQPCSEQQTFAMMVKR